jgi:hypothetical protein
MINTPKCCKQDSVSDTKCILSTIPWLELSRRLSPKIIDSAELESSVRFLIIAW